jgi:PIN domain nuclease of toxin-antitoxin system
VILLDTNALIWLEQGHTRARSLRRSAGQLFVSPATLLELGYLQEAGRIELSGGIDAIVTDDRWFVDDVPATRWLMAACELSWTRDPFDRLIVAHARVRDWRLATGDAALLARLPASARLSL